MKKRIMADAPKLHLDVSDHFPVQLIRRMFDLSVLIPLYAQLCQAKIGEEIEMSIGHSTIVAIRDSENTGLLVTGWKGSRGGKS